LRILVKPSQVGIGGSPPIHVFIQARNSSIVDDFSSLVAPCRVDHLSDGNFAHIASDDPVDQPRRVTSRDEVFKKRRNVDERGRIPYGVVFVLRSEEHTSELQSRS